MQSMLVDQTATGNWPMYVGIMLVLKYLQVKLIDKICLCRSQNLVSCVLECFDVYIEDDMSDCFL